MHFGGHFAAQAFSIRKSITKLQRNSSIIVYAESSQSGGQTPNTHQMINSSKKKQIKA